MVNWWKPWIPDATSVAITVRVPVRPPETKVVPTEPLSSSRAAAEVPVGINTSIAVPPARVKKIVSTSSATVLSLASHTVAVKRAVPPDVTESGPSTVTAAALPETMMSMVAVMSPAIEAVTVPTPGLAPPVTVDDATPGDPASTTQLAFIWVLLDERPGHDGSVNDQDRRVTAREGHVNIVDRVPGRVEDGGDHFAGVASAEVAATGVLLVSSPEGKRHRGRRADLDEVNAEDEGAHRRGDGRRDGPRHCARRVGEV